MGESAAALDQDARGLGVPRCAALQRDRQAAASAAESRDDGARQAIRGGLTRTGGRMTLPSGQLIDDLISLGGAGSLVTALPCAAEPAAVGGAVRIGVHRDGPLPADGLGGFDILL